MNVSIDQMAEEIMKGLTEYADLATEDMKKAVRKSATTVKNEIKANAPQNTGAYANSWATKTNSTTSQSLEMTVYSKTRFWQAHLLEHGHAKRGGGRVAAQPHIADAEAKGIEELEKAVEEAFRG